MYTVRIYSRYPDLDSYGRQVGFFPENEEVRFNQTREQARAALQLWLDKWYIVGIIVENDETCQSKCWHGRGYSNREKTARPITPSPLF